MNSYNINANYFQFPNTNDSFNLKENYNYHKFDNRFISIDKLTLDDLSSELIKQSSKFISQKHQFSQNLNYFSIENLRNNEDEIINIKNIEKNIIFKSNCILFFYILFYYFILLYINLYELIS
jgi:hypothetical protein